MNFQGKEIFEYAKHINNEAVSFPVDKRHLSQAAYRAVINRSYYGAFIQSRDFLNIVDTSGSVHGSIGSALKSKNRQVGNSLSGLLKLRKDADYKTYLTFSAKESKESLRLASKILAYIDSQTTS